ncbi:hypothetical protein SAMN04487820_10574 [Actinopolyspora mzabensis]|uniref:Uncharacterized protein n=1 Tax=Actinopolyspora mzabensis TaxID=995066 RepID=A0A1G8ZQ50_ACTMZ|nr:hypothetical protein SAMN04487820_10574 [Actinopolyspora mzabensis]
MADGTAGFTGAREPQAADSAAAIHEREALEADRFAHSATGSQQVPSLGDYPPERQLANEFGFKTANGSAGAAELPGHFSEQPRRRTKLFRQTMQHWVATENAKKVEPNVPEPA